MNNFIISIKMDVENAPTKQIIHSFKFKGVNSKTSRRNGIYITHNVVKAIIMADNISNLFSKIPILNRTFAGMKSLKES